MEKSIKITNLSFLHFVISLNPLSFHNKVCVLFVFQQKLVHPGSSPTSFQQFLRAIQKLPQDTVLNKCLKKKVFLNFLGCVWWCVCVCVCVCVGNMCFGCVCVCWQHNNTSGPQTPFPGTFPEVACAAPGTGPGALPTLRASMSATTGSWVALTLR